MDKFVTFIVTSGGAVALIIAAYALFVWGITRFVEEKDEE